jgi:hypothetical protein
MGDLNPFPRFRQPATGCKKHLYFVSPRGLGEPGRSLLARG